MDENKEVNSTDPKREKVRVIPLSAIDNAPDHPFGVRDDEEMAELVESISTFGVINPVIVRKVEGERYDVMRQLSSIGNNINQLAAQANSLSFVDAQKLQKEAERWHKFQADVERQFLRPEKREMKWQ